jgi:hypothetical protein
MVVRPSNREIANQPVVAFVARSSAAEWDTLFLTTATSGLNNHGSLPYPSCLGKGGRFTLIFAEEFFRSPCRVQVRLKIF